MSGGERTEERPGDSVIRVVREQFGLSLNDVIEGWAGEESVGWRVPSPGGDRFVQRFPRWRRAEELGWCDEVAAAAATQDPACVHAVPTDDGRRAIETSDGPVMVFPFVDGDHPDDHVVIAAEAARLLARIHRGIAASWTGKRVRAP